jgi:hypothetical protein
MSKVKAAAELLDKVKPDWYTDIDLGTLSLTDSWFCVLGQVYGNFSHGFVRAQSDACDGTHGEERFDLEAFLVYALLPWSRTRAWKKEIRKRRREKDMNIGEIEKVVEIEPIPEEVEAPVEPSPTPAPEPSPEKREPVPA